MNRDINTENLFNNMSLYEEWDYKVEDAYKFSSIFGYANSSHQFDCFCIECEKESTFKKEADAFYGVNNSPRKSEDIFKSNLNSSNSFNASFQCQRNENHVYHFSFVIRNEKIIKIGQYPSSATVQVNKIKRYQSILNKDYNDFSKAIGLYSHGIGIGSFVYLRRIFENLIEEKHQVAKKIDQWNETEFQKARMDDKIKILSDFLPEILVETRRIYGILSKGIHSLTETECKEIFPQLKLGIELILDEKIHMIEQEKKVASLKKFVSTYK